VKVEAEARIVKDIRTPMCFIRKVNGKEWNAMERNGLEWEVYDEVVY
jgi:hypothetical protein